MCTVARGTIGNPLIRLLLIVLTTLDSFRVANATPASILGASANHRLPTSATRNRLNLPRAVDMSRKFSCKEPQSRAYHLRDLMEGLNLLSSEESANQPPYIVARRCDAHSGCCMSLEMVCAPSSTYYEDVEIEIWSLLTNETRRQWITIEQHEKCGCELMDHSDRQRIENQKPNVTLLR